MIRYAEINLKNSIKSRYFLYGIFIIVAIFFFSKGRGELMVQVQQRPLIIQEIFRYPREKFLKNIESYSSEAMFSFGLRQFMYLAMPLSGIGFLLRFCDERYGGYDRMMFGRIGRRQYLLGTLLSSALLSILTIVVSFVLILAVLYVKLPSAVGIVEGVGIGTCLRQVFFACILSVIGGWMGFFTAVVTESRFLSLVFPVLFYEIWTEMCTAATSFFWFSYSMKNLFDPVASGMPVWRYILFVLFFMILTGGGFYLTAQKKFEKGR